MITVSRRTAAVFQCDSSHQSWSILGNASTEMGAAVRGFHEVAHASGTVCVVGLSAGKILGV